MLLWSGLRCCTYMNAIPVVGERFFNSSVTASSPPADAPIATTGKGFEVSVGAPAAVVLGTAFFLTDFDGGIFLEFDTF